MLFNKELSIGEIITEAWELYSQNFMLMSVIAFITLGIRLIQEGYAYWRNQKLDSILKASNTDYVLEHFDKLVGLDYWGMLLSFSLVLISLVMGAVLILKVSQHYLSDQAIPLSL